MKRRLSSFISHMGFHRRHVTGQFEMTRKAKSNLRKIVANSAEYVSLHSRSFCLGQIKQILEIKYKWVLTQTNMIPKCQKGAVQLPAERGFLFYWGFFCAVFHTGQQHGCTFCSKAIDFHSFRTYYIQEFLGLINFVRPLQIILFVQYILQTSKVGKIKEKQYSGFLGS